MRLVHLRPRSYPWLNISLIADIIYCRNGEYVSMCTGASWDSVASYLEKGYEMQAIGHDCRFDVQGY